jgi:two-component system, NarL family, sensor kinase
VAQVAPVGMLALGALALSQLPLAIGLARRVSSIRKSRLRLLAQTVRAVELERQRLAQDLHDDVIQDLSGVAVTLEALGRTRDGPHATVDRTAQILRRDVAVLRDIVADLFPVATLDTGLDAAIRELGAGLVQQGVVVELDLDPDTGVDPVTAGLIHRVAREAMVNVSKHAEAGRVEVELSITADSVHLRVADDGRGAAAASSTRVPGHVGLDIVRETIAEAGGTVVVAPRRPRGTTVTATLPR